MAKEEEKKKEQAESENKDEVKEVKKEEAKEEKTENLKDEELGKEKDEAKVEEPKKPVEPDWKDQYARLLADFDNFKKRTARDREDTYRFAEADILKDILPVVDNLSLALANAKDKEDAFVKGVQLVYDSLLKSLNDHGAKMMEDLVGKELDPNFHEAIATLPSAEVKEGCISNVAKTGWTLNDRLLRAAQVVVSAGAGAESGK